MFSLAGFMTDYSTARSRIPVFSGRLMEVSRCGKGKGFLMKRKRVRMKRIIDLVMYN